MRVDAPTPAPTVRHPTAPSHRNRASLLVLGRLVEQGSLGIITVLVAARLSVEEYGPVAVVLVLQGVAATLADLGLGSELLRLGAAGKVDQRQRLVVGATGLVAGSVGLVLLVGGGGWSAAGWGCLVWLATGQLALRQSATMRSGRFRRLALSQICGASTLVAIVVVAAHGRSALGAVGAALVVRAVVELLLLPSARPCFAREGLTPRSGAVLASLSLGYGARNVDYLVAGPLLGPVALANYVLAFRLANATAAPVGFLSSRLGLLELSAATTQERGRRYRRLLGAWFTAGVVAALGTVVAAGLLPSIVGDRWRTSAGLMVVLAVALPWRFVEGLVSAAAHAGGRHGLTIAVELVRLVALTVAAVAGAAVGLWWMAVLISSVTAITGWWSHRRVCAASHGQQVAWLTPALLATLLLVCSSAIAARP